MRIAAVYLAVHVVAMVVLVVLVRWAWPVPLSDPGAELSHLQAGLISAVWHLPLTAFVYRFAGANLVGTLGLRR